MATIIAVYAADLISLRDKKDCMSQMDGDLWQTCGEEFFPGFPPGAKFTQADLEAILRMLGKDPENVVILGAGWAPANQAFILTILQNTYLTDEQKAGAIAGLNDQALTRISAQPV